MLIVTPADEARDYSLYESRLRSELLAAGFSVSAERLPGTPDVASLASNAEQSASQAAIAISISEGQLCGLLWIGEQSKASGLIRPIRCCPLDDAAPLVFAVRATDSLSAGLLELRYRQAQPAREAEPAAPKQKAPTREEPPKAPRPAATAQVKAQPAVPPTRSDYAQLRWHPQASGVVAVWLREFPVAYGGKFELARDFDRSWSAGIQGYALAPASVSRSAGTARISQFLTGAVARYRTELIQRLAIVESLGGGVYGIDIGADAVTPYRPQHASSATGYFSFEHQIHLQVIRELSMVAGIGVTAPWKRYSVVIVDTSVARAAAPLLLLSLGLQLNL